MADNAFAVPAGQCYLVGGAVRDQLLGGNSANVANADADYVIVGATPEQLLAAGYKPVGADFPVFLHPTSKAEYALARTERKQGRGYHGFTFHSAPTVTLEEDLRRRDLTINAMAMDAAGNIIDPHNGRQDLSARLLRHVSPAFAEDPVRILRVARFAATLPHFTVADDTQRQMRQMVENGEAAHLQSERVWRELARGLTAAKPSRMIEVLHHCGALQLLLPEVAALDGIPERLDYHPEGDSFIHTKMVIDAAAARGGTTAECFAALLHDIGKAQTPPRILPSHHGHEKRSADLTIGICDRLKPPRAIADLARLAAAEHGNVHNVQEMRPATIVDLLSRTDAFRRPDRFESLLRVCEADFYYLPERATQEYPQGTHIRRARAAAAAIDAGAIARSAKPENIAEAIRTQRIKAIKAM